MIKTMIACLALGGAMEVSGCGAGAPHEYPASAAAQFHATCPANDPVCICTWDQVTRSMTYEDYQAALDRYRNEGLMDPRITRARTHCIEHRHPT